MRVFKYLNHDEMVASRVCVSKDVDLSNMLFSAIQYLWITCPKHIS